MGNCQAAETATAVIQHPGGYTERIYWPLTASHVMASNPGHYVAVIVTTAPSNSNNGNSSDAAPAVQHLKLLRPDDTLLIGHVYRLVSFEEVLKVFGSKRSVKLSTLLRHERKRKIKQQESDAAGGRGESGSSEMVMESETQEDKVMGLDASNGSTGIATTSRMTRYCQWRPTLQSIAEAGS
ncbi:uncharacterized protein [Typha angustifolia]|uniref:uncharacterized protein n=1 Tax=Typha angustifolia TaxID=59011 RepID=UPI003C2CB34B